jgi:hypothetical protein
MTQAIKIDALWKPVIRKFRQCIKQHVINVLRYELNEHNSECTQGFQIGEVMNVPEELLKLKRTQLALYMMV